MSLFERLYSTEPGSLQDNFISYWVKVAARFANNPYVVGYDPLNEPFPSNIYTDPELFYSPGAFDHKVLQPLYKRVFEEAYLPASSSKIMFYEPAQIPDAMFHSGFTDSPAGSKYTNLQLMNDHSYGPCALLDNSTEIVDTVCNEYH
jgi:endoglycosylceramidase